MNLSFLAQELNYLAGFLARKDLTRMFVFIQINSIQTVQAWNNFFIFNFVFVKFNRQLSLGQIIPTLVLYRILTVYTILYYIN
jgi:hypothetical protein